MAIDYDRLKRGLTGFVRSLVGNDIIGPHVDYLAAYPCKVVTQNADGTLELQPDDVRLPPMSRVPIKYGIPGVTATVQNGGRALVEFSGANPQYPFATIWESASLNTLIIAGGSNGAARNGDTVGSTTAMGTWMTQVATAVNLLAPGSVTPPSPASFGAITQGSTVVKVG